MTVENDQLDKVLQHGYRFALALTHDQAEAQDLLHDVALRFLSSGSTPARFALLRAIKNRYVDDLRRLGTRGDCLSINEEDAIELPASQTDEFDIPLDVRNGALECALQQLRPAERAVLFLSAVDEMAAQQIAELLDCPRSTVLSQLQRGKTKLRKLLEQCTGG